jgi:hypothetical protein
MAKDPSNSPYMQFQAAFVLSDDLNAYVEACAVLPIDTNNHFHDWYM